MNQRKASDRDLRGGLPKNSDELDARIEKAQVEPIRHAVVVRSDPIRAFTVFTEQMGTWWPVNSYSRAVSEFEHEDVGVVKLEFQARMGGLILEHMSDGRVLPWAEVVAWEPPHRVLMAWRPHSSPEPPTELEVKFAARDGATQVELEHRGWGRLSEGFREGLYELYVRGWPTTLESFVAVADQALPPRP